MRNPWWYRFLSQVFRGINCTSESSRTSAGAVTDVTIGRCLREASLSDLLTVKVRKSFSEWWPKFYQEIFQLNVPMYTTPFGPIVDGVVIPDQPLDTISQKGQHINTFAKYDVMFGLTESEAFHLFPASLGKKSIFMIPAQCWSCPSALIKCTTGLALWPFDKSGQDVFWMIIVPRIFTRKCNIILSFLTKKEAEKRKSENNFRAQKSPCWEKDSRFSQLQ